MPTTYNGIGTHYYGKKNVQTRTGVCQICGAQTQLSSYDTRLWFVIVFIPVIPIARKRIVDYCSKCSRHYAIDLHKWEAAKQLEISGALDKFRSNPTPEAAIEAHRQLINFHQTAQAAEFRTAMCEKFPDNAKVHAYLGAIAEHLGQYTDAAHYYGRSLELRSDLPEARVGVATGHMRSNQLDAARKLLDFLEKDGAAQLYSLEPLERLALAYQKAGQHESALELFHHLQKELPAIAQIKAFRKNVKKSEKALKRTQTILPKAKFSWKQLFATNRTQTAGPALTWRGAAIFGIVVALILGGFVIANEYIRRHRTLYIVNALKEPAKVEIRGAGTIVASYGLTQMVLPEGNYHASISSPVKQETDFSIRSSYFDRWGGDPAWVLNVGNAAVLSVESAVYSANPRPTTISFYFGQPFFSFPRVTHPFKALPRTVSIEKHEQRTLTELEFYRGELINILGYFLQKNDFNQALAFGEWALQHKHTDDDFLQLYVNTAESVHQTDRAEKILRARLDDRPVNIEWHRSYQHLVETTESRPRLASYYDAALQKEPANSALLYLRGRIASNRAEGRKYFTSAIQADGKNPYPLYALGFDQMVAGKWASAKKLLSAAVSLKPKDHGFSHYLYTTRFALQEFPALESELTSELKNQPLDLYTTMFLCDVLVAEGKRDEATALVAGYERAASSRYKEAAREGNNLLHRHLLYVTGDFPALERHASKEVTNASRKALFEAYMEQSKLKEALQIYPLNDRQITDPYHFLAVTVALRLANQPEEAEKWQAVAIALLKTKDSDASRVADVLSKQTPPTAEELDELAVTPKLKAIIVTVLAQKFPALQSDLEARASTLNTELDYPHYLIARAISH